MKQSNQEKKFKVGDIVEYNVNGYVLGRIKTFGYIFNLDKKTRTLYAVVKVIRSDGLYRGFLDEPSIEWLSLYKTTDDIVNELFTSLDKVYETR